METTVQATPFGIRWYTRGGGTAGGAKEGVSIEVFYIYRNVKKITETTCYCNVKKSNRTAGEGRRGDFY